MGKLPVTVLSGFLGSGKTTLLKKILSEEHGKRIAVIVNDMAEVNIDGALVADVRGVEEKLVQMQNGCICCTLREDLIVEVANIAKEGEFDHLVIESTGIGEPMQVAEAFAFDNLEGDMKSLGEVANLDALVTVVDLENFNTYICSKEQLTALADEQVAEGDVRSIAHLLIDQVECANVILLNKRDRAPPEKVLNIKALVRQLNPDAKLYETTYCDLPWTDLLGTKLFDLDKTAAMPKWMKDLEEETVPETEEYGISSFVWKARKPFHPERWNEWVTKILRRVVVATDEPV